MRRIVRNSTVFILLVIISSCEGLKTNSEASFPGGANGLRDYIVKNVRYPQSAIEMNMQGKVQVKFVVEKTGTVSYAEIESGVHLSLDKEALRVVRAMPKWVPAYVNGIPVRTICRLPINFTLE